MRGTDPMGSGSPAFPVHKETDGWEGMGGSGDSRHGRLFQPRPCPRGTPPRPTRTLEISRPAFQRIF